MKPFALVLASLAVLSSAAAVQTRSQKQVIITYPEDTPDSVMDQAKAAIVSSGGTVSHTYEFIKGFAATVAEEVLNSVRTMDAKYQANVEEDKVVSIS